MVTLKPDKDNGENYLGKRTEEVTYCEKCGELLENCQCEREEEEESK